MTRSARSSMPAEVVRLHVDRRDPLELLERGRRDLLDVDVEHVGHAQVLGPRHALHRADDRRRLGAAQQVAQRQAARQRVGIGIVVQQDEHAICVGEVALILLDPRARHRPAELGDQRRADQLRQLQVGDVGELGARRVGALGVACAGVEHVDQRAAGVADRRQHLLDAAAAVVFDDEAGAGGDVGFEVGVDPPGIAGGRLAIPASWRRRASGRLSTRKSTSKLGSSTSSSERMTSSSWQMAKTRTSGTLQEHGQTTIIRRGRVGRCGHGAGDRFRRCRPPAGPRRRRTRSPPHVPRASRSAYRPMRRPPYRRSLTGWTYSSARPPARKAPRWRPWRKLSAEAAGPDS